MKYRTVVKMPKLYDSPYHPLCLGDYEKENDCCQKCVEESCKTVLDRVC